MHFDPLRRSTDQAPDASSARSIAPAPLGIRRERREVRRERRLQSAEDLLRRMEPVLLAMALLDALSRVLLGAVSLGVMQLSALGALALVLAWSLYETFRRRRYRLKQPVRLLRGIVLLLCLPWFLDTPPLLSGTPGPWLWLAGTVLVYSVILSAPRALILALLCAAYGEFLMGALHPAAQGLEMMLRTVALLALGQLGVLVGRTIDASGRTLRGMRIGEQRARAIAASMDVIMIVVSRKFEIVQVNHAVESVLGYSTVEFKRVWSLELLHPDDRRAFLRDCHRLLRHPGSAKVVTTRIRRKDGAWASLEVRMTNLLDNHAVSGIFASVTDITARVAAEERLRYQASHDDLTGLYNRSHFTDRLAAAMVEARQSGGALTVFFCDLDFFKSINDRHGHETGDHFLKALSAQLAEIGAGPGRLLSRFGGDEFVLFAQHAPGENVIPLGQRLLQILSAVVRIGELSLQVEASIGMAQFRPEHDGPQALIRDADAAMYQAKESGRNRIAHFDDRLRLRALRRAELAQALRGALERGELSLAYQPKVDLHRGRLTGFEVLVRWDSVEFGSITPTEFIPIAEEAGHIVQIGLWALQGACRQLGQWQRAYPTMSHLSVAVNVSMRQLMREDFVTEALQVIEGARVLPGTLELEITESAAMTNPEQTVLILEKLKTSGLRLALDDFGTGYSSLAYLRRLPVDVLKIDRAFVHDIQSEADDAEIVRLVIALARALGIKCVAEGIESHASACELRRLGCDIGQGYYFAQPMTDTEAESLLRRDPRYEVN